MKPHPVIKKMISQQKDMWEVMEIFHILAWTHCTTTTFSPHYEQLDPVLCWESCHYWVLTIYMYEVLFWELLHVHLTFTVVMMYWCALLLSVIEETGTQTGLSTNQRSPSCRLGHGPPDCRACLIPSHGAAWRRLPFVYLQVGVLKPKQNQE